MRRKIIQINQELCNGCGACAAACHEGAIQMIEGKATLVREDYCDGLGDCLPACPTKAISFEEREALAYDAEAVRRAKQGGGCPGSRAQSLRRESVPPRSGGVSRLAQWPCQLKLVPVNAPYFEGANLLIAADCTAFAHGNFHEEFIRNHITLIGCPKLDEGDYTEKLTAILRQNNVKSVKIVRMEVPCCGELELAVKRALQNSGKFLPWQVVIIGTDGKILE